MWQTEASALHRKEKLGNELSLPGRVRRDSWILQGLPGRLGDAQPGLEEPPRHMVARSVTPTFQPVKLTAWPVFGLTTFPASNLNNGSSAKRSPIGI